MEDARWNDQIESAKFWPAQLWNEHILRLSGQCEDRKPAYWLTYVPVAIARSFKSSIALAHLEDDSSLEETTDSGAGSFNLATGSNQHGRRCQVD